MALVGRCLQLYCWPIDIGQATWFCGHAEDCQDLVKTNGHLRPCMYLPPANSGRFDSQGANLNEPVSDGRVVLSENPCTTKGVFQSSLYWTNLKHWLRDTASMLNCSWQPVDLIVKIVQRKERSLFVLWYAWCSAFFGDRIVTRSLFRVIQCLQNPYKSSQILTDSDCLWCMTAWLYKKNLDDSAVPILSRCPQHALRCFDRGTVPQHPTIEADRAHDF